MGIRAFTIVELLVVIGIIIIVIGFSVPAFNSMSQESRLSQARATLSGALTRAHILSISDRALTAVRLYPADWEATDAKDAAISRNRQRIALYQFRATGYANPESPQDVAFDERLERIESEPTRLMPSDIWAAPTVAMREDPRADGLLRGKLNEFAFNPAEGSGNGADFLNADDFLIVFGADGTGVQSDPRWNRTEAINENNPYSLPRLYRLRGYVPEDAPYTDYRGREADGVRDGGGRLDDDERFQRYAFDGLVLYEREAFTTAGVNARPDERRAAIRATGRPYYVSRIGGSLLDGASTVEQIENN